MTQCLSKIYLCLVLYSVSSAFKGIMSKVGNSYVTGLLGQTLAGGRTFGHYIYGKTGHYTCSKCHNYSVCTSVLRCPGVANNGLCVVWPGKEAMFSLDVMETSVAFEL